MRQDCFSYIHRIRLIVTIFLLSGLMACGGTRVTRVSPDEEIDITDKWNETDSRQTAQAMIGDMLEYPWLGKWYSNHDRKPRVFIATIQNKSHEHIPIDTFINDLKRFMLKSDRVQFVSAGKIRDEVRQERREQELYATEETRARMAEETGADFALSGSINSTVQQTADTRITFYQVDLNLIDMTSTEEVWYGQKKIKKKTEKGGLF